MALINERRNMRSTFYVTTPIHVNDNPHVGHAHTTILADVLALYRRGRPGSCKTRNSFSRGRHVLY